MQMTFQPFSEWFAGFPASGPLWIAGPCSAETEEQVMETCLGAAQQGAHALRAGIWKPRTRPESFEGVGEPGLAWVKAAGTATGLPVCVEVAKAAHVETALRAGIDFLWVGARTTVNPFAVQEIADALRGVEVPVLVKNPVNPDLELWIGALERLSRAGIRRLGAVHRGFSMYGDTEYRNSPLWEIPVELRRRLPNLPLLCDPSHICGKRETIPGVAQNALDLGFDGLMVEVHRQPDQAWSDARQQFTPDDFGAWLHQLVVRRATADNPLFAPQLETLRRQIDRLDEQLVAVLGKRMDVAREIGLYKLENGVAILQLERWREVFRTRSKALRALDISDDFAHKLLQAIHQESIAQQARIMQSDPETLNLQELGE
jgi:chorismate mutase